MTTVRRVSGKRIASSAKGGDMAMRGHIESSTHAAGREDRTGYIDMYMHPIRCRLLCVAATFSRARPLALSCDT